ncbi:MAG: hypothetical protein K6E74_02805 [Bacilli bacterium]|nr:hypothetical protein [Bacilli bacterium]
MEEKEVVEVGKKKKLKRPFDVTVKIYKIVSIILYCIWTSFLGYLVISASIDARTGEAGAVIGWIIVFILLVAGVGLIGYGIMTFIGITGLSLAVANKDNPKRKGNIIFFAIETVVSVGTYFVLVYFGALLV